MAWVGNALFVLTSLKEFVWKLQLKVMNVSRCQEDTMHDFAKFTFKV